MKEEPYRVRPSGLKGEWSSRKAVRLRTELWRSRALYIMLLPGLIWFAIYKYLPMHGLTIAFKDYDIV